MRQNEPNIYIEEKKMRSIGGYGQRCRSARAATGCDRVLRQPRPAPRAHPRATRSLRAGFTGHHVRALPKETPLFKILPPDKDHTTLFSIYYICRFLLFFRISIFYFLVDALRNSPVVLDPLRSVRSHDRMFSILFFTCVRLFEEHHVDNNYVISLKLKKKRKTIFF